MRLFSYVQPKLCLQLFFLSILNVYSIQAQNTNDSTPLTQVKNQLYAIARNLRLDGFQKSHDYRYDSTEEGSIERFSVTLNVGKWYKIASVCDNDCHDLDLELIDENGNVVEYDLLENDQPMLFVKPKWTGSYTVKVKMQDCQNEPCTFGIGIFSKR